MYETFFGLSREPFSVAPDPAFLYMSAQHREALEHLNYGLRRGGGFVLLTGEIGAGKTTVWRCFLEQLPPELDVAYVVNPKLGVEALLARICDDLRVELPEAGKVLDPIDALHGHLLLAHARGRRTLVVVDEAQALSLEVMEQLRLLTNLDTSDRKLVQVLLIGQPELRTMLEKPVLEPLAQRVVARFHLQALPETETRNYIAHRLAVAGWVGELPFDAAALDRIHELCGGVPRRINVLCDRTLIAAHGARELRVGRRLVDLAAGAVFGRAAPASAANEADGVVAQPPTGAGSPAAERTSGLRPGWLVAAGAAGAAVALAVVMGPWAPGSTGRGAGASAGAPAAAAVAAGSASAAMAGTGAAAARALAGDAAAERSALESVLKAVGGAGNAASAGPADEARAWQALGALWGATLGPGEACEQALQQGLRCFRGRGGLAALRQLDRPALLRLADEQGRVAHVLLVGLAGDRALLRVAGADHGVPLVQLARAWRGEFTTLWKPPPGWREGGSTDAAGPLAAWLGERLAVPAGAASAAAGDPALRERLLAFQQAQGLQPDGQAGPLTLMQLNRSAGIDEPRLSGR